MKTATTTLIGCAAVILALGAGRAEATESQGFLYGTVETASGNTYRGILRWGTEESFWDDHFNSAKQDLPYREHLAERERRSRLKVFGITVGYRWDGDSGGRQFIARFGDLRQIEVHGGDRLTVTMKNGEAYRLNGGSNDVGAKITVHDASLGEVKLEWRKIESITFSTVPASVAVPARRLYGVLTTERGETFEGFVQWDIQECLWTDLLDGETEDGDLSIEMGKIRAIEKRNRNGSWVDLKDGRRLLLEGTNDVDHTTDGIFVEDERFGRVEVGWDEFERLDFQDTARTGRGYDDYEPAGKLSGKVTAEDGETYSGRIVFDLDEAETWEMLQGEKDDVKYHIPFELVRSIEPRGFSASRVVLKSGLELILEDGNDVSDDNDGVLILDGDGDVYLEWRQVKQIDFD